MAAMDRAADAAILDDVLLLADLARPAWDDLSAAIPAWHPRNEEPDPDAEPEPEPEPDATPDPAPEPEPDLKSKDQNDPAYLKAESRKHEREKKAALKREAELKERLDKIDAANLSEQEKAIKAAREEARNEALTEAGKERRADKLELAVTRIAVSRGVKVGEKTVKFADADDVQMWIERQIAKGDVDGDDIYADGKVDTDALASVLTDLAASKPSWLIGATPGAPAGSAPAGDADAGKGGAAKGLEALSVADHVKNKSRG